MSINFCYDGLATVETNRPCSEEYPAANLVSLNLKKRTLGYIADHFVKPPVAILFKFCCSVNIDRVVLKCMVGAQKSSVIQVLAQSADLSEKCVAYDDLSSCENGLVLYRHGAKPNCETPVSFKCSTFINVSYLRNVRSLKVRILRTERSTVPALGIAEIWGEVSRQEQKRTLQSVHEIWKQIKTPKTDAVIESKGHDEHIRKSKVAIQVNDFEIPEEFLDPITQEIFTLPMSLPSGKIVDISTLEKFYKAEEEWGRGKSDPYTGLVFTDTRKPIVAATLKTRLDKFLLKNCENPLLKHVPRTVGRKNPHPCNASASAPYAPSSSSTPSTFSPGFKRPRDIDSLLESSLSGLPSFLEKPVEKKEKKDCIKCDSKFTLFRISCKHLICRCCLLNLKKSGSGVCTCGSVIEYDTVERYHPE